MTYGCHNRPPINTFGATTCQYTLSEIGKVDQRCEGCKEKKVSLKIEPRHANVVRVFIAGREYVPA